MIYLGANKENKKSIIENLAKTTKKVFIIQPKWLNEKYESENIETIIYDDVIMYVVFHRLLQEIDKNAGIVINECMVNKNRHNLNYNCIRNWLNQADIKNTVVFQKLPIIDDEKDFFILNDFNTKSIFKLKDSFDDVNKDDIVIFEKVKVNLNKVTLTQRIDFEQLYSNKKQKILNELGSKDPNIIPRHLYQFTAKYKSVSNNKSYLSRNNSKKLNNISTYISAENKVYDFCIDLPVKKADFIRFLTHNNQRNFNILHFDIGVDNYYFNEYNDWFERIYSVYSKIQ